MKVSLIIAVYKDVDTLKIIIESLKNQTYRNFEVVIVEDGEDEAMKGYIDSIQNISIIHTIQEDIGVRKSRSQNNGIRASKGDYLIFIDGDCILYNNFIENHVKLSSKQNIVSGRRVNLGPKYSNMIKNYKITSSWLQKNFIKKYFDIAKDAKNERHSEEGLNIRPFGFLHKLMIYSRKKEFPLLGCNFSCYKSTMIDINGFDEALGNAAVAGDTDLEWRFKGLGYKVVSGRFIVNQFHLYHKRKSEDYNRGLVDQMKNNQNKKLYKCIHGIKRI